MIDTLKEVIANTHALGFLELVKVVGTPEETTLTSMATDRSVVLNSTFLAPVKEFEGTFGLHDLGRLNTILNIPEYKENAFIQVKKSTINGVDVPTEISFANASRDFRNSYRFMGAELIESQIPSKKRREIKWDVTLVPTDNAIQRLKYQAQAAGSTEQTFQARVDKGNLYFSIGDHSSHTGEFVFAQVAGKLNTPREWPLPQILGILSLTGDKTMEISDDGIMQITVTSGSAKHQYSIMSQMK